MKKRDVKNMRKIEIKSLGIVVGIILLFSSTIAMAQSSDIQSISVSVGPAKVISWDNIPKGNIGIIGISKEIAMPIGYIKYQNKRPPAPIENILPKNEIDTSDISQQPSQISQQSYRSTFQPTLTISWDSLDDSLNPGYVNGYYLMPPDPIIAAGPNYVGVMVNDIIAFYYKNGTLAYRNGLPNWYSTSFNSVFGSCPDPTTCFITDPRIIYDQNENHWIAVALGINTGTTPWTTYYFLTVSNNADPRGSWFSYAIPANLGNTFADYPDLGFDGIPSSNGGAIYVTSNQFDVNGNFINASLSVLPKSSLYIGVGFSSYRYSGMKNANGFPADTLRAVQTFGNPSVEYLVDTENVGAGYNNNVTLWSVNPTVANSLVQANVPIGSFNPPPPAQQKGGRGWVLDTIDNRIYNAVYRNGSVYAAFTVANGATSSIRYLQINTSNNSTVLNVNYGATGKYYWFPSITTDNSNSIYLVFAYSSSKDYAGIRYTTRKTTDTVTEPSTILRSGQVAITGSQNPERWGDYFGIAKDPSDNSVWIYGEYAKNIGPIPTLPTAVDWGTFVGRVTN